MTRKGPSHTDYARAPGASESETRKHPAEAINPSTFPIQNVKGGGSESPKLYHHDCSSSDNIPGHTTRAPPVGFERATNGIQLYAIANMDKTSLSLSPLPVPVPSRPVTAQNAFRLGTRPFGIEFAAADA